MFRRLKRKAGYVLAWVLTVFVIVSLLGLALISAMSIATRSTLWQHDAQQAYYTAKSAASTIAEYISQNAFNQTLMNSLVDSAPVETTNANYGRYSVDVTRTFKPNSSTEALQYTITATAFMNNQKAVVTAHMRLASLGRTIPTEKTIYVNGSAKSGFNDCIIKDIGVAGDYRGGVYVNGDMKMSTHGKKSTDGCAISGDLIVKGKTTFAGGASKTNDIVSFGSITLDKGATINGNVWTKGDLKMSGAAKVLGGANVFGSFNMKGGTIPADARIAKNVTFSGNSKISGKLYYGGRLKPSNVSKYVPNGAVKQTIDPFDFYQYLPVALPIIYAPTITNTVVISASKVISDSGKITSTVASTLNSYTAGTLLTIDTGDENDEDINLVLENTQLILSKGINIVVKGTNNVYLYLKGTSSIKLSSTTYFGMDPNGSNPKLFIIGDGTGRQEIKLESKSAMNALVYMPKGSLTASGDELENYKFVGCCIVKKIYIRDNVTFKYSPSEVVDTPLDLFGAGDEVENVKYGWIVEKWS